MTEPVTTQPARVDVLVPSWRRPQQLEQALASIEAVRHARGDQLAIEVYVIDEAAGSGAGPAAARNLAAAGGSGEFIALLDDDDRWTSTRLSRSIEILQGDSEVALVCGDAETDSGSALVGRVAPPPDGARLSHQQLAMDCFVCASTVTLRRVDWESAGGMDEQLRRAEDYDLWLRLTREGRTIHLLPQLLSRYGEDGFRLSDDAVAMALATRTALARSAQVPAGRLWRRRLGTLDAVIAHGLARQGQKKEARALALDALRLAPTARVAWTALGRALRPGPS